MMSSFILTVHAEDSTDDTPTTTTTEAPAPSETTEEPATQPTEPTQCSHAYGDWDGDEGSHWRTCTKCGNPESAGHSWASETITVEPTCAEPGGECKICTVCQGVLVTKIIPATGAHTYSSDCDADCNVCGAAREVTHTFGTYWDYNSKGHWHVCTKCAAKGELLDHYPGPAATEEKDQICLTCRYVMTKKKEHTHKTAAEWSSDASGHWHACSGCDEMQDFAAHTYDDPCDPDCNTCGYLTETAHSYDGWRQDGSAHWQVCTLCGEESAQTTHVMDEETGLCADCGFLLEEIHVHEFLPEWQFGEEQHWQECECGDKSEPEDHIWDDGEEDGGMITYTCAVCQAEKQEEAPRSGLPVWIFILLGVLVVALVVTLVCLIKVSRKGRFAQ